MDLICMIGCIWKFFASQKSISSMTGIAIDTIENSIEPYLVRKGLVIRTQKGRVLA